MMCFNWSLRRLTLQVYVDAVRLDQGDDRSGKSNVSNGRWTSTGLVPNSARCSWLLNFFYTLKWSFTWRCMENTGVWFILPKYIRLSIKLHTHNKLQRNYSEFTLTRYCCTRFGASFLLTHSDGNLAERHGIGYQVTAEAEEQLAHHGDIQLEPWISRFLSIITTTFPYWPMNIIWTSQIKVWWFLGNGNTSSENNYPQYSSFHFIESLWTRFYCSMKLVRSVQFMK
jgi:hypothetical protein